MSYKSGTFISRSKPKDIQFGKASLPPETLFFQRPRASSAPQYPEDLDTKRRIEELYSDGRTTPEDLRGRERRKRGNNGFKCINNTAEERLTESKAKKKLDFGSESTNNKVYHPNPIQLFSPQKSNSRTNEKHPHTTDLIEDPLFGVADWGVLAPLDDDDFEFQDERDDERSISKREYSEAKEYIRRLDPIYCKVADANERIKQYWINHRNIEALERLVKTVEKDTANIAPDLDALFEKYYTLKANDKTFQVEIDRCGSELKYKILTYLISEIKTLDKEEDVLVTAKEKVKRVFSELFKAIGALFSLKSIFAEPYKKKKEEEEEAVRSAAQDAIKIWRNRLSTLKNFFKVVKDLVKTLAEFVDNLFPGDGMAIEKYAVLPGLGFFITLIKSMFGIARCDLMKHRLDWKVLNCGSIKKQAWWVSCFITLVILHGILVLKLILLIMNLWLTQVTR